jgi:hypothetical protein
MAACRTLDAEAASLDEARKKSSLECLKAFQFEQKK